MTSSTVVVLIVLTLIVGALASIGIRWLLAQPKMTPLRSFPKATFHAYGHDLNPIALENAFIHAVTSLDYHTKSFTRPLLADVRIFVMPENEWTDDWGRRVAGLQNDRNIVIGRDFAALCHELAHRHETLVHGPQPVNQKDHAHWAERGYNAAVDEYHAWLLG